MPQPTPLMLFSSGFCTLPPRGVPPLLAMTIGPLNRARMWRRRLDGVADTCRRGRVQAGGMWLARRVGVWRNLCYCQQHSAPWQPLTTSDGWSMTARVRMRCRPEVARVAGDTFNVSVHLQVGGVVAGLTDACATVPPARARGRASCRAS